MTAFDPVIPDDSSMRPSRDWVVAIPTFGNAECVARCLESVLRHTSNEVEILILDDHARDLETDHVVQALLRNQSRPFTWLSNCRNGGFPEAANRLFELAGTRDVILLNSDVIVEPNWDYKLAATAAFNDAIATVTAATNHGTLASDPVLADVCSFDEIRPPRIEDSVPLIERAVSMPTAVGHCTYVARLALDAVGRFSSLYGRGYGEEVDFSLRATELGFVHLLQPAVLVGHRGGASFGKETKPLQARSNKIILELYPWYESLVERAARGLKRPGIESKRVAELRYEAARRRGLDIALDMRMFGHEGTGTSRFAIDFAVELANQSKVRTVVAFAHPRMRSKVFTELALRKDLRLRVIPAGQDSESIPCADIIIRPCQVFHEQEMKLLRSAAPRMHIHVLDMIAVDNLAYHGSLELWSDYESLQAVSLTQADALSVNSDFVRASLAWHGCIADPFVLTANLNRQPPVPVREAPRDLRLLMFGAGFPHKNRAFGMAVAEQLANDGFDVELTIVGPTPVAGSSLEFDREIQAHILSSVSRRGRCTIEFREFVSKTTLEGLIESATVVLYPSLVEGFGLIPFECARRGTPCISSRGGSLDTLPLEVTLKAGSPSEWAARVLELHRSADARARNVLAVQNAERVMSRNSNIAEFVDFLFEAVRSPRMGTTVTPQVDARVASIEEMNLELTTVLRRIYASRRWSVVNKLAAIMGR